MDSIQDLIEEAKLRTVWWILCIFSVSYFLTHTSKSMLMNIPIAILFVGGLRILLNEVEFRWKVRNNRPMSYLSHLEKKQLSVNDSRLTTLPAPPKWKRKIDSPVVEAAIEDFVNKLLHDFVIDLWYSDITPDKEAPELIHGIVMDVLGEVSARVKELNLVDLLTRDVVDLIGDHLDLFRRNQAAIGVDVMGTLSCEERDERLKHHLMASKELHPALISPECEYKVLQRLMGGLLAVVLRPREAQCPLVRCIARELLTCLVMQPVMNFASPEYINELIEYIILAYNDEGGTDATDNFSNVEGRKRQQQTDSGEHGQNSESNLKKNAPSNNQGTDLSLVQSEYKRKKQELGDSGDLLTGTMLDENMHTGHAEWVKVFEAATQRRTEVLMPENLENMWAIGRNYKKKLQKKGAPGHHAPEVTGLANSTFATKDLVTEAAKRKPQTYDRVEDKVFMQLPPRPQQDTRPSDLSTDSLSSSQELNKDVFPKDKSSSLHELDISCESKNRLKRSNSTSDLKIQPNLGNMLVSKSSTPIINEYYSADVDKLNMQNISSGSNMVLRHEGMHIPKLRCRSCFMAQNSHFLFNTYSSIICFLMIIYPLAGYSGLQVVGAYFEKLGSKSFAVYSIAVTGADNTTWFVKRRYRNFERLHRHLKDIPNYTLHLPPKRIFSSSTEDAFVHQRCIQLDKYLQELLSIANVAEQHEVWDFLSASSKNYAFGKSPSVMRTLAVNVDDAMDDIVRQFKGVSDGLMWKVGGSPSSSFGQTSSVVPKSLSWNTDDINKLALRPSTSESLNSFSDNDDGDKDVGHGEQEVEAVTRASGLHSDYELSSKGFPTRVVKHDEDVGNFVSEEIASSRSKSELNSMSRYPEQNLSLSYVPQEDPSAVPPEWTPPNLSVPVLNLVDNVFQLKRRGWLRRQVFWISKQILQLVMEDAIDDWLLRQIQWLRRDDVIAQGIRWVQDVLWPGGTFFLRLRAQNQQSGCEESQQTRKSGGTRLPQPGSFEQQLEAARRASDVKKMIFNGAPTTLVSLIGNKQYRRCARDIYYFLQSTVCLKQLGYGILELVLISIFPELRDVVMDIHEKNEW
ncbi:Phox-associated domain [Striga asiatica]|uniref:Phox-associated domain n=1 Tax=Striga asiatica TaxID=4170 RepID=A0A5A7QYD0_STRAF|nr:Phox-associated domain [Striga asiatica]